jgi:hypothetical protein
MSWDYREYLRQRQHFLANRGEYHPMALATTLIFSATWLAGWLFSSLLLWRGMTSMPLRYGLAFVASYAVFFLCVRIWCNSVHHDRGGDVGSLDSPGFDGEGCLVVLAIVLAALLVVGLFWASGGFVALLEVAFGVVFAGTVVKRLGRAEIVGNWAGRLLAGTWLRAVVALIVLVGVAAGLQHQAPGSVKFSEALRALFARGA